MKFSDFFSDLNIRAKAGVPSTPKVSIILPTYARAHGPLQQAVDSVLSQSFGDFELIIVDDGSRDGTADILEQYLQADSRVVIHSYHRNSGLPALRVNQAALHAKGKYIAYQFDDDTWTEDSLLARITELERRDSPAVVYANARVEMACTDQPHRFWTLGGPFNYGLMMNANYIANNAVVHHRQLFELAGMYDPHVMLRRYSDYDLWLRFAKHAEFIWVDHIASHVRANLHDSLGKDVPAFFTRYRKFLFSSRNHLLRPGTILDYDVLDLTPYIDVFTEDEIREYYKTEAIPFLTKFNDYCSDSELAVVAGSRGRRLHLLTVKPDYSTSVDVTINNFIRLPHQRAVASTFVKEADLPSVELNSVDVTVLYRTVGQVSEKLIKERRNSVSTVYLMDDNMLWFHEVGPEHSYLAPKEPTYERIVCQIEGADACIGYSEPIIEDLAVLNRRTIRLDTNIPHKYISKREYLRGPRFRIAILSGSGRKDILRQLWPAFTSFASKYSDSVEFHFWGIDPADFEPLDCPVHFRPFSHVYERYLEVLRESTFDVVLVPLDHSTRAARSKSPVKLLEATVAGAICIFTDAPPYAGLPDDCCLKVANTVEDWERALNTVYAMDERHRAELLERARSLICARYITESQFFDFLAAFDAVRLHRKLGEKRIAYAFHEAMLGGATLHLLWHAALAHSLGFKVVGIVRPSSVYADEFRARWNSATSSSTLMFESWPSGYTSNPPAQRPFNDGDIAAAAKIAEALRHEDVGLLHFATWSPTMSLVAQKLDIPAVASVHAFYEGAGESVVQFATSIHCSSITHGLKWASAAKSPMKRIVCPVDDEYFAAFSTNRQRIGKSTTSFRILVSGTLQPRKNQLAAVQAAVLLLRKGYDISLDLIGYTEFLPEYVKECRKVAEENGLGEKVILHGFIENPKPFYDNADILLIAATDESMPQTMLQAMAAGVPVISTNVGGVSEIIKHRYSGLLTKDHSPASLAEAVEELISLSVSRRLEIIDRAHRAMVFLARRSYVRFELIDLYNQAFDRFDKQIKKTERSLEPQGKAGTLFRNFVTHVCAYRGFRFICRAVGLSRKQRLWDLVSPAFFDLKKFTEKHFWSSKRTQLILGEDLRTVPYREYLIPFPIKNLTSVSLAISPLSPVSVGAVGIEILSDKGYILAQVSVPLSAVSADMPVRFDLPQALSSLEPEWKLRVFVRNSEIPIAIYELIKYSAIRRRRTYLPFALFR